MTPSDWDVVREAMEGEWFSEDVDTALNRLQAENERLREALRWISQIVPGKHGLLIASRAHRALQPEAPPQAGDLLVIPYRHGDIIPAGWTVEGDKMWRRADASDAALQSEEEA